MNVRHAWLCLIGFLPGVGEAFPASRRAAPLTRGSDPVVLTGSALGGLAGIPPGDLVAFRYLGAWQQVPVQVDERAVVSFSQVYNGVFPIPAGITTLAYTDAGTHAGADPDATLDANDEVVFMAEDAGDRPAAFSEPGGVIAGSGLEVTVTDPLGSGPGYVYLFRRSGGALDPAAGQDYVAYAFSLASGPYLTTYAIADGPNPENTFVTTSAYRHHFSDRWIDDELWITSGVAVPVDLLDRHRNQIAPGDCGRTEDVFSGYSATQAEGAFVTNKDGPVRAIRSYLGANSGPLTQREHRFYRRRHDIETNLRVHSIPGMMDFFIYSAAASGMTYANDLNPAGVTVDGNSDAVTAGALQWERLSGAQGSLAISHSVATNIPSFATTSYFEDNTMPAPAPCAGAAGPYYGASGIWINATIPNTDPILPPANNLMTRRVLYYEPPGLSSAAAQVRDDWARNPLTATLAAWTDPGGGPPTAATPVISPAGGAFMDSVLVTLTTATAGAEIRYTTDGTLPTASSTLYAGPFTITLSQTITARAFMAGFTPSAPAAAAFAVTPSTPVGGGGRRKGGCGGTGLEAVLLLAALWRLRRRKRSS